MFLDRLEIKYLKLLFFFIFLLLDYYFTLEVFGPEGWWVGKI